MDAFWNKSALLQWQDERHRFNCSLKICTESIGSFLWLMCVLQTGLNVSLRSFSHDSLSQDILWNAVPRKTKTEEYHEWAEHRCSSWIKPGSLSHLCLITEPVRSCYRRRLQQRSFMKYRVDENWRNDKNGSVVINMNLPPLKWFLIVHVAFICNYFPLCPAAYCFGVRAHNITVLGSLSRLSLASAKADERNVNRLKMCNVKVCHQT